MRLRIVVIAELIIIEMPKEQYIDQGKLGKETGSGFYGYDANRLIKIANESDILHPMKKPASRAKPASLNSTCSVYAENISCNSFEKVKAKIAKCPMLSISG